jgi:hypothetical protein
MIYVYAITAGAPPKESLDGVAGLADAPLAARTVGEIGAVYSGIEQAPSPARENILRHEQAVETLMQAGPLLPARFGTVLRDGARLDHLLTINHDRLAAGLDRVRGCVELGVRVMWGAAGAEVDESADEPSPDATTGTAYLMARAAQERRRRSTEARAGELAANLNRLLRPCAKDGVVRVLPSPRFVMAAAYLVPRDQTGEFRDRVNEAGASFETLRLLCSGPWPPYHFVPELEVPRG